MILEQNNSELWVVYYKRPTEDEVHSETTSDLHGTHARLEAAGYLILEEVIII